MNEEGTPKWLETPEDLVEVRVVFRSGYQNGEPPVVQALLRTGEVLTLNESSLSYQRLPEPADYALSVILATAVLTQLLSSWKESVTQTIAAQPRMLITFLMACEMITTTWAGMAEETMNEHGKKKRWRRDRR